MDLHSALWLWLIRAKLKSQNRHEIFSRNSKNNCNFDKIMKITELELLFLIIPSLFCYGQDNGKDIVVKCSDLRMGQYICTTNIDPATQQPVGCTSENIAKVSCRAVEGLICQETGNNTFERSTPCKWTNGYSYSTTLLLSVFLGVVGADRFYLGHVGMGALKFCTLGFLFIGQLVDVILIATQYITPKDGSNYVVGYYGPAVETLRSNNDSHIVSRTDWF